MSARPAAPIDADAAAAAPATMPARVLVASLQASSDLGAVEANTKKFAALTREAAAAGAKFIVMPETAITGYLSQDLETNWMTPQRKAKNLKQFKGELDPAKHAETVPGPSTDAFCALAKELGVYVTVPLLEKAEVPVDAGKTAGADDAAATATRTKYFNTVCLAGPDGRLRAHYRKTSPWPTPEQSWANAGTDVAVADTEYGRVGLAICFDIHSVLAKYHGHSLWALLYPIAWVGNPEEWFRTELPKNLRDANCPHHIIGCNWSTDKAYEWPGAGFSTHYGPRGELHASTGDAVGSTIVYSSVPTAATTASVGELDLRRYAHWTRTTGGQAKEWKEGEWDA